jgi:hypothetical protein
MVVRAAPPTVGFFDTVNRRIDQGFDSKSETFSGMTFAVD